MYMYTNDIYIQSILICVFHIIYGLALCTGGYGYVFVAQDTKSGKEYALKVPSTYANAKIFRDWVCYCGLGILYMDVYC